MLVQGTNCHGFTETELASSQTGGICTAVMRIESVIKNPITVSLEAYQAPQGLSIGLASPVRYAPRTDATGSGYNTVLTALKQSEAQEQRIFKMVQYLPEFQDVQVRIQNACNSLGYKPRNIEVTSAQAKFLNLDITSYQRTSLPTSLTLRDTAGNPTVDGAFVTSSILETVPGYADLNQHDGIGRETLYGPISIGEWNALNVIFNPENFTINTALSIAPAGYDKTVLDFTGIAQHEMTHLLGIVSRLSRWSNTNCSSLASGPPINVMDLFAIEEKKLSLLHERKDIKNATLMLDTERDSGLRALSGYPTSLLPWYGGCIGTKNADGFADSCSQDSFPVGDVAPFESNRVAIYDVDENGIAKFIPLAGGGENLGDSGDGTDPSHIRNSFLTKINVAGNTPANYFLQTILRFYRPNVCPDGQLVDNCIPSQALMEPAVVNHKSSGNSQVPSTYTLDDLILMDLVGMDINYKAAGYHSPNGED